jgi:hypothetical protein
LGECAIWGHSWGEFLSFSFLFQHLHISSHFRFHVVIKFLWTDSCNLVLNCILFDILNWISNNHWSIKTSHLLLICILRGLIPSQLELLIISFGYLICDVFSNLLWRHRLLKLLFPVSFGKFRRP